MKPPHRRFPTGATVAVWTVDIVAVALALISALVVGALCRFLGGPPCTPVDRLSAAADVAGVFVLPAIGYTIVVLGAAYASLRAPAGRLAYWLVGLGHVALIVYLLVWSADRERQSIDAVVVESIFVAVPAAAILWDLLHPMRAAAGRG